MGLGSSIKKSFKKITRGVKKVFKGAKKVVSKVTDKLRSVGREIKRFAKSDLGKFVIAAALVYAGGAALLASQGGMSFGAALANPAAVGAKLGSTVGLGSTSAGAGATSSAGAGAAGATSTTAATGGVTAATGGVTAATGGATAATTAGIPTAEMAIASGTTKGVAAGANAAAGGVNLSAGLGSGSAGMSAGAASGATSGGLLSNPLVQYGGAMVAGNAVSGMMGAKAEEEAQKEAERQRQRAIDGNIVGSPDIHKLAGFKYDPVHGESSEAEGAQYVPKRLQHDPYSDQQKRYTTEGLLTQGSRV